MSIIIAATRKGLFIQRKAEPMAGHRFLPIDDENLFPKGKMVLCKMQVDDTLIHFGVTECRRVAMGAIDHFWGVLGDAVFAENPIPDKGLAKFKRLLEETQYAIVHA